MPFETIVVTLLIAIYFRVSAQEEDRPGAERIIGRLVSSLLFGIAVIGAAFNFA